MGYYYICNGDVLYHHGIKGQKWGVRRFQNKDGSLTAAGEKRYKDYGDGRIEIEKGAELQRLVGDGHKKDLKGISYASFTKYDNNSYIKTLTGFMGGGRDTKLTLTAKTKLVSPSKEEAKNIFFKMLKDNPDLNDKYGNSPFMVGQKYTDKELDAIINGTNDKKLKDAYDIANTQFMFNENGMSEVRDAFFEKLRNAGFNMLRDENDISNGYAKSPIILLDASESVSLKSSEVITKAMRKGSKEYVKQYKKKGQEWADDFFK